MPVKKTTKRAAAKKAPVKKTVSTATQSLDKFEKTLEEKFCNTGSCTNWTVILLVLNTVFLLILVSGYTVRQSLVQMEAQRVGGMENYRMIQEIYEMDAFKQQQRFQIEQTYQAIQSMGNEINPMMIQPELEMEIE